MEHLIDDICAKTGIDRATAEKVAAYVKDNLPRLPALLGQTGGLGDTMGKVASKVGSVFGRH